MKLQLLRTNDSGVRFEPIVDFVLGRVLGYRVVPCVNRDRCRADATHALAARDAAHERGCLAAQEWAWRESAIQQAKAGRLDPEKLLVMDVDPRILDDAAFAPGRTQRMLEQAGLTTKRFVLRVSVPRLESDHTRLRALCRHYSSQGFPIALHGVDADAASLSLVQQLHPDVIDLDATLMHGIGSDSLRWHLAVAFAEFCRHTSRLLLVDGIDNFGDLAAASRAGIRFGCGFVLGRPAAQPENLGPGTRGLIARLHRSPATLVLPGSQDIVAGGPDCAA